MGRLTRADVITFLLSSAAFATIGLAWLTRI